MGVWLIVLQSKRSSWLIAWLEFDTLRGSLWKLIGILTFFISIVAFFGIRFCFFKIALPSIFPTLWLVLMLSLVGGAGLKIAFHRGWPKMIATPLITIGIIVQIISFIPAITNYPFALGWGEGNTLYYASLPFSERLYHASIPLSPLNPTIYLLRSIPFLVNGLPIWTHRLWNVILAIGIPIVTAWAFVRRFRLPDRLLNWLLAGWFFLHLFYSGAVYYNLQICVILILLGVSTKHPWRSLFTVLAASIWAGLSRLNWYPVPAILAAALYLLEQPVSSFRNAWRYIAKPLLWGGLGIAFALAAQSLYAVFSGNSDNIAGFTSSLTSDLLWYRLLPNPTYPLGILPGICLISLPFWGMIGQSLRARSLEWHPLRLAGLGMMLLTLFVGGLVVSVKIGGGSDLHNLDAYRVLLALVAIALYFGRYTREGNIAQSEREYSWGWSLFSVALLIVLILQTNQLIGRRDSAEVESALQTLRQAVSETVRPGKSVLFITQRQLLTFGLAYAPLVQEYERIELMEMVMSHNRASLDRFQADLRDQRFGLIIVAPRPIQFYGSTRAFGEENDLMVQEVNIPMLCYYTPMATIEQKVQLLVPRQKPFK